MNRLLTITIDVEPDCSESWRYSKPLTFYGVTEGIRNRLQPLFNRYNIYPTYLINNVVLEDAESVKTFKDLSGNFELGTHLHPEFIEPQKEYEDYAGKKGEANCCFYEPDVEFGKIRSITDLFIHRFGYAPTAFRAGRFSAGLNTIDSLKKLGYKVDTSVTPHIRWDDKTRQRAVDFRSAPTQPYWINSSSMVEESLQRDILEVPVSIIGKKLSPAQYLQFLLKNKRPPYKGVKAVWLRPVYSSTQELKEILDYLDKQQEGEETVVYNMMFHNVEVMPGLSPYSATEEECERYLHQLESLFRYCLEKKIKSIGLSELYDIFR